jgi:hypothetical protein
MTIVHIIILVWNKKKNKEHHTIRTILKSYVKIVETKLIALTHKYICLYTHNVNFPVKKSAGKYKQ